MPIYTRTGDNGSTALYGGKRVLKSSPQIMVNGDIDELSSFIGLIISFTKDKKNIELFTNIQKNLYLIMTHLSGAKTRINELETRINEFEQEIDLIQSRLPKLSRFILPQGTKTSSLLNIARAVCRRAERGCVLLFTDKNKTINDHQLIILKYLNRLSDLLFVLARHNNTKDILT